MTAVVSVVLTGMIPQLSYTQQETSVSDIATSALKAAGVDSLMYDSDLPPIVLLDIDLNAPLGLLPQSSEHSDYLMADLAKARVCLRTHPSFLIYTGMATGVECV